MENHSLNLSLDDNRHLIVGDIHGRFDLLQKVLEKANYDPSSDILYSVGDMMDRGKDSVKVLQFFQEPNRYTVKGNHELMCLSRYWRDTWLHNGGYECLQDLKRHKLDENWLHSVVEPLPWIINVGDLDELNSFRIVHAEVPPRWSDKDIEQILDNAVDEDDTTFAEFVWGRSTCMHASRNVANMKLPSDGIVFNPDRKRINFCGHTPINKPIKVQDTWFIDTWNSKSMTIIDAITFEKFTAYNC